MMRLFSILVLGLSFAGLARAADLYLPTTSVHSTKSRAPASIPRRQPASVAKSLTFDDYLRSNAANPALTGKVKDHQKAFVDNTPAPVFTMPKDGSGSSESASAATPATPSSASASPPIMNLAPGAPLPPGALPSTTESPLH